MITVSLCLVKLLFGRVYTVEPPNNGHIGDKHFVHCSEVVPCSEVEMYGQYIGRGRAFCPLFRGCPLFGGRNVWTIYIGRGRAVCPL